MYFLLKDNFVLVPSPVISNKLFRLAGSLGPRSLSNLFLGKEKSCGGHILESSSSVL